MSDKLFIGIDVAKDWIDIAFLGRPGAVRVTQTEAAIAAWLAGLDPTEVGLVAFEPTGGYERQLAECLRQRGVAFARVHPNEITAFRTRRGVKAKIAPSPSGQNWPRGDRSPSMKPRIKLTLPRHGGSSRSDQGSVQGGNAEQAANK